MPSQIIIMIIIILHSNQADKDCLRLLIIMIFNGGLLIIMIFDWELLIIMIFDGVLLIIMIFDGGLLIITIFDGVLLIIMIFDGGLLIIIIFDGGLLIIMIIDGGLLMIMIFDGGMLIIMIFDGGLLIKYNAFKDHVTVILLRACEIIAHHDLLWVHAFFFNPYSECIVVPYIVDKSTWCGIITIQQQNVFATDELELHQTGTPSSLSDEEGRCSEF